MTTLQKIGLLLLFAISTIPLFAQQPFPCSDANGKYTVLLVNPNVQDGDDGNIDGICLFRFVTEVTAPSLNAVVFTYVGTGSAAPLSVTHKLSPVLVQGVMNVKAPCNNLDIAFDITTLTNIPLCMIRNVVMPVELIKFEAKSTAEGVHLSWITASEHNNLGFELERSENGKSWKKLTFIEGHLTTLSTQQYEFMDKQAYEGQSYYRLKQIDLDGAYEYSEVISTNYEKSKTGFSVFPNPASDMLTLQLMEKEEYEMMSISVFDALGKLVLQKNISSKHLSVANLTSGFYTLVIRINNQIYTERFMKN